jgi:hypothetical protein
MFLPINTFTAPDGGESTEAERRLEENESGPGHETTAVDWREDGKSVGLFRFFQANFTLRLSLWA